MPLSVPGPGLYFEPQRLGLCGLHALNMAVGQAAFTEAHLHNSAAAVVGEYHAFAFAAGARCEARLEDHVAADGWFSEEAMAAALAADARWSFDQTSVGLQALPGASGTFWEPDVVGALVHRPGHWVALRVVGGAVWLLDSLRPAPQPLGGVCDQRLRDFLAANAAVYPLRLGASRAPASREPEVTPSGSPGASHTAR